MKPVMHKVAKSFSEYPYYACPAACGFPSPAADYLEDRLSLDQLLVEHPAATFFARAQGDSMLGAGIHDGDLLIIDRALTAQDGDIIIALLDGELLVKRLYRRHGRVELHSENTDYSPIIMDGDATLDVWGVVIHVIHSLR
ncbi:translesion error-prone DNA polymerase V autoproteolytic subunit [Kistimonas scapharcae]|uniref:Translesion error-prone DNA polymerase V autoproteolytic subunit n=1 Tax=Kistimonas scapharcae TaxID=1036133 RepID=A0ABP8V3V2_9GAMM